MSTEQLIREALNILKEINFESLEEIQSAISDTENILCDALSELENEGWDYKEQMERMDY